MCRDVTSSAHRHHGDAHRARVRDDARDARGTRANVVSTTGRRARER